MKLVVGLGNPGVKYEHTRHNVGFMLLNAYAAVKFADGVVWLEENKFSSHVIRFGEVLLVKPQTFMNRSGEALSKLSSFYKIEFNDILVVHDDVDLKFGEVKLKKGSGSAGHHGVEDTISRLGSNDFWRLRVGVGRPEDARFDVEDYVLQGFSEADLTALKELFEKEVLVLIDNFVGHFLPVVGR
ncbi:MAG: aminoacyl-tRNA hydrolase [Patescibacteria group bacterium]